MDSGKKKRLTTEAQPFDGAQDKRRRGLKKVKARARRTAVHGVALRRGVVNLDEAATGEAVCLAVKLESGEFTVDREGHGALRNVSIIAAGPAIGHGFAVDEVMLEQVAEALNSARNGVKVRLTHPWEDAILCRLGRTVKGAKVDGYKVRGDIVFGPYASKGPKGDLAGYVMDLADEDGADIGLSISFEPDEYEEQEDDSGMPLLPLGRLKKLLAVDIVDDPAANPDGLLRAPRGNTTNQPGRGQGRLGTTSQGDDIMKLNAKQRAYLASCGLATDATDEQIQAAFDGLTAAQAAYYESLADEDDDKDEDEDDDEDEDEDEKKPGMSAARRKAVRAEALAADKTRRAGIVALASGDDATVNLDTARKWADDGVTLGDARRLARMAKDMTAVPTGSVAGGEDRNLATIADGISDGLLLRVGVQLMTFDRVTGLAVRDNEGRIVDRKPCERAERMRSMPVGELARQYLGAVGVSHQQLSALSGKQVIELAGCRRDRFGEALRQAGGSVDLAMSTSDFPYILADAMGKVFLGGYNLAPATWQNWCRRQTAPDFKQIKLLNLSEAPALQARAEGQGISFGSLSESRELVALGEFTSGLKWTRQAQINDDLGVLRDGGAMALGAMARYKEDDVIYAILTANAEMSDGTALFHADHSNLSAGAETAVYAVAAPGVSPTVVALFLESEQSPVMKQEIEWDTEDLKVAVRHSVAAKAADHRGMYKDVTGNVTVASLAAILQAMSTQTGPGGAFLNLRPAFILCPSGTAEVGFAQLVGSSVDPSKANATPNPFFNRLTVIGEPRLNA